MGKVGSTKVAGGLIALAALGFGGSAMAHDQVAGALLGAGAGAIVGHAIGGPDAAVAGGLIGAVTGAAVSSHHPPPLSVHYAGGYGYAPPAYYPGWPRAPVYVVPPPPIIFVPSRGHGFWQHGVDAWGRPFQTWVPVPPPRRYDYAPRPWHSYPSPYGPRW